jgi:predicted ATPase
MTLAPAMFGYHMKYADPPYPAALQVSMRLTKVLVLLKEDLAAYRATGALSSGPNILQLLAACHRRSGQPKQGLNDLDEAAAQIDATQVCYQEAEMHRLRGELLVVVDDPVAAEASLHQAIAVARRQSAKLWELRAATSLARLWREQGKRLQAYDLLTRSMAGSPRASRRSI